MEKLGYFLKPSELFDEVAKRGNNDKEEGVSSVILEDLQKIHTNIQLNTMGTESLTMPGSIMLTVHVGCYVYCVASATVLLSTNCSKLIIFPHQVRIRVKNSSFYIKKAKRNIYCKLHCG